MVGAKTTDYLLEKSRIVHQVKILSVFVSWNELLTNSKLYKAFYYFVMDIVKKSNENMEYILQVSSD